jgi:hypothetical protein
MWGKKCFGDLNSEATDEALQQAWLEYSVQREEASCKALVRVHANSANLDVCKSCETCAQNEAITRRLMNAEGELQSMH